MIGCALVGASLLLFFVSAPSYADSECFIKRGSGIVTSSFSSVDCVTNDGALLPLSKQKLLPKVLGSAGPKEYFSIAQSLEFDQQNDVRRYAVQWYEWAAKDGYVPALLALGLIFETGVLVERDLLHAHKLYQQAVPGYVHPSLLDQPIQAEPALNVEATEHELELTKEYLYRLKELKSALTRELAAARSKKSTGDALEFALLSQRQRVKRAESERSKQGFLGSLNTINQARESINAAQVSEEHLDLLLAYSSERKRELSLNLADLEQKKRSIADLRDGRGLSMQERDISLLAFGGAQSKDKALKQYLNDLESSVQHRKVSNTREQKKLDFLEKRISRLKRQNKRTIKKDDQVALERALSSMDARYQGQIDYLADNLQQESDHANSLKQELDIVQAQAKDDRALVVTITERLDRAAKLVDQQTVLVKQQSKDLRLAIDSMNQAHMPQSKASTKDSSNDRKAKLTAVEHAPYVSPAISLKWPEYSLNGDDWVVQVGAGRSVQLVGALSEVENVEALELDGEPVSFDKNGVFVASLDMFGQTKNVVVVARDKRGTSVARNIRLEARAPAAQARIEPAILSASSLNEIKFGRYHALIFGNNDYGNGGYENLDTAINDAKALANLLTEQYGFEVELVVDATREQMIKAMESMRKKLTEADNLLIYYAGHGIIDPESNEGYWVPTDGAVDSTSQLIANATITSQIRAMTARNVMVVSDSCYSGSLMRSGMMYVRSGLTPEKKIKRVSEDVLAATRVVLSSGGLQPVIDSIDGNPNSVFTSAMLESLKVNDGLLDADSLATKVSHMVAMATADTVKQVPRFAPLIRAGHEGGEFYFVPKAWRERVMQK